MAGRRVKYLHPIKMYIFISVVYFLCAFNLTLPGRSILRINETPSSEKTAVEKETSRINADTTIDANTKQVLIAHLTEKDTSYAQYLEGQKKLPEKMRDGFWGNAFNKHIYSYKEKYGKHALEQFVEDVQHNIPKMMFVLLPLFAWQLQVAFRKNKKFYVEHLIFAFHYFCFNFLFLSIVIIIERFIPPSWTSVIISFDFVQFIVILLYFYKALKAVYHHSTFRTITKMFGVSLGNFLMSLVCLGLVVIITALISG